MEQLFRRNIISQHKKTTMKLKFRPPKIKFKFQPPKITFHWPHSHALVWTVRLVAVLEAKRAELTNCDRLCLNYLLHGPLRKSCQTPALIFELLSSKLPTLKAQK